MAWASSGSGGEAENEIVKANLSTLRRACGATGREPLFGVAATRRIESDGRSTGAPASLMDRAGEAVARLALALAPHAGRILVLAGPGNNGGDGLEAAARLRAFGKEAAVVLLGDAAALPADAARAHARARDAGVTIGSWPPASGDSPGLVIDALLGIGGSRPPAGDIAAAIGQVTAFAARGIPVLAVDLPSGLDPDRGQPLGEACVVAEHTLALIGARPGPLHRLGPRLRRHRLDRQPRARPRRARAGRLAGRHGRVARYLPAAPPRRAQGQLRRCRDRRRRRRHGRRGACSPPGRRMPPAPAGSSSTCSTPTRRRCRPIPSGPS